MFYGKLIAGLIGFLVAGPLGLLIGLAVGHLFDRGLRQSFYHGSPEKLEQVRRSFFDTTFLLLGYLAKADGRVSQAEIDHTEALFTQQGIRGEQRRRAIERFREGASADFRLEPAVGRFLEVCGRHARIRQALLVYLVAIAMADSGIDAAEREALQRIARLLGFTAAQLEQLLRMAEAQSHFHREPGAPPPKAGLQDAYAALGVSADCSDKELKRAYRKLMSEHHPDKLIARGLPDDMVRVATETSQEIQAAYEQVKKHRGMR